MRFSGPAGNSLGLLAAAGLPALLMLVLWLALPERAAKRTALPKWMLALLPIGLGMWAAHLSFHLLTAWGSLGPGLLQAGHDLARFGIHLGNLPVPDWTREQPLVGVGSILPVQLGILDAGLLGSLYLGWRFASHTGVLRRAAVLVPWAAAAAGLYAAGVWILLQPMQMRGMAGM